MFREQDMVAVGELIVPGGLRLWDLLLQDSGPQPLQVFKTDREGLALLGAHGFGLGGDRRVPFPQQERRRHLVRFI